MSNSEDDTEELKKGWRWWLFKYIGPKDVQMLVDMIDDLRTKSPQKEITIYPAGVFTLHVRYVDESGVDPQPFHFRTMQERHAFEQGLHMGMNMEGDSMGQLSAQDLQILDEMQEKSTHSDPEGSTH